MNRWILAALIAFLIVVIAGFAFPYADGNLYSLQCVVAVLSLMYMLTSVAMLGIQVLVHEFGLSHNPYVHEVKEMSWNPFNPMYFAWLYANNLRKWTAYVTVWDAPFAVMIGTILSSFLIDFGRVAAQNLWLSIAGGTALFAFASFCLYEGVYKEL